MALSAINVVATRAPHPTILWTAPEDRGGDSANIWQLPELRLFATKGGWFRYAFHQCEMAPSRNPRPMAVLSLSSLRDETLSKGWPKLTNAGTTYLGPLKSSCTCGQTHEPWAKIPLPRTYTALEKGVLQRLLSIAYKSGLARHLRTGSHQARQSPLLASRSLSPSSSSSSLGSATTCVSSSSIAGGKDLDAVQWDDEAADALDLPKRNQDSRAIFIKHQTWNTHGLTPQSIESLASICTTGIFCGPHLRGYALPSCEGMPLLCAAHHLSMPLCAAHHVSMPLCAAFLKVRLYALLII